MLFLLIGCDVYNQGLIDGALGDAGVDEMGGGPTGGGTGGSIGGSNGGSTGGSAGVVSGGNSGTGATGGASGSSGEQSGGGTDTSGGTDSGGSGSGRGGSTSGDGGTSGSAGSAGQGGMPGGSGGEGNTGGSAGPGGAGNAGSGQAGGGAGGAGTGGGGGGNGGGSGGGSAGSGGSREVCTGCARLSVPLAASGDKAHFTINFPAATNMSAATIAFRVARYAGTGGWFKGYIQEGSPNYLYQDSVETTIASIGTSMQTISWNVATAGTTADKTIIRRIGIEISGAGASSWTSPTVLYVDSIVVTGATLTTSSFTFDTSSTVYTTPISDGPNDVLWLNNYSGDTNVTGAALSWLGP